MYKVSSTFSNRLEDRHNRIGKIFFFPDLVTDRSDKITETGEIVLRQYEGENISGTELTFRLSNDSKEFNFLISNKDNIGNAGGLYVGFSDIIVGLSAEAGFCEAGMSRAGGPNGEFIWRYKGQLEDVEFSDEERHLTYLTFNLKTQKAIDRRIGSTASPVDYTSKDWNPADLALDILENYSGLSGSESAGNKDVDYSSWLAFKTISQSLFFNLKARFTGQTVSEALSSIGLLSDCLIYGDTDGKIYFRKFIPSENPSTTPYLDTDADFQSIRLRLNRRRIINRASVWYGFNHISDLWVGVERSDNLQSQTDYGIVERVFDSKVVWHSTQLSASAFGERLVVRYPSPLETVEFQTKAGTPAPLHQIGDLIEFTSAHLNFSSKVFTLHEIRLDLRTGEFNLIGEENPYSGKNYFILDSTSNGVLDQNILF